MILIQRLQNKQGEVILIGGASRAMPVRSWPARGARGVASALARCCRRMRLAKAKGWLRTGARTVRSQAETTGMTHEVMAESAIGQWPNEALQRIAARWRFCLKLNGLGWAARAEGCR